MYTTPVLTYQDHRELARLVEIFDALQPRTVLEIGSAYGGTLYEWIRHCRPGDIVVSIDLHDPQMGVDYAEWQRWAKQYDVSLFLVEGDSTSPAVFEQVAGLGAPYDFIFIDGDHRLAGVTADWYMYRALARDGSLIVFDDIKPNAHSDPPCEVSILWAEIRREYPENTTEIIGDMLHEGNGIGIVKYAIQG